MNENLLCADYKTNLHARYEFNGFAVWKKSTNDVSVNIELQLTH